jgi:fimbrial chaperone protein
MSRVQAFAPLAFLTTLAAGPAVAQSLQVAPLMIDLPPAAASSVLTLHTDNNEGVAVQARVFRWFQADGEDKLEKTEDLVISPPVLTLRNGTPSTLRLVRVAKTPVAGEETYRVVIDELPNRKKLQAGTVALTVRQSLPVFFAGDDVRAGSLAWKVAERKGKLILEATNAGQKRVKLTKLAVTDGNNHDLVKNGGLAYVLGGQTKAWELSGAAAGSRRQDPDHQSRKRYGADPCVRDRWQERLTPRARPRSFSPV